MRSVPFSAKAEYACIAMLELAARHGSSHPIRLKEIAEGHRIPQRFLVQILLQLKGSGLVISARGAAGGYLLARPPETITLADLLNVIDRNDRPAAAPDFPRRPPPAGFAGPPSPVAEVVRDVWKKVQSAQQTILEDTTLADLTQRLKEG